MLRLLRRSFGISASRVAVRPDVPWYWRWVAALAATALLLAVGWLLAHAFGAVSAGRQGEAEQELGRLQETLERQEIELAELRSRAARSERQLDIDRAAAADLAKQVKALTFENAGLKEDLAFFQSLMAGTGDRDGALSVNRFRLQPAAEGEYRYQMLLVQAGPRSREFQGRMEFVLDVQHQGRKLIVVLPPESERDGADFQLSFRFFQRVEGSFRLAPDAVLKGMQVRVFESGARAPKLTQTLGLS